MKTKTEIDEEQKLSEKANQRWENEGGEVPEVARLKAITVIEEGQTEEGENLPANLSAADILFI